MAELLTNTEEITSIANAIRTKGGTSANLTYPSGFVTAIEAIAANGDATAADIKSGKKAWVGNAEVTGTAGAVSASDYYPTGEEQTIITSGKFTTGAQKLKPVTTSNLSASNVRAGVTVKVGSADDDDSVASVTGTCVEGWIPQSLDFLPFILYSKPKTGTGGMDTYFITWESSKYSSGSNAERADGVIPKHWISRDMYVPVNVTITYYESHTSSSTKTLTLYAGTRYTLSATQSETSSTGAKLYIAHVGGASIFKITGYTYA